MACGSDFQCIARKASAFLPLALRNATHLTLAPIGGNAWPWNFAAKEWPPGPSKKAPGLRGSGFSPSQWEGARGEGSKG